MSRKTTSTFAFNTDLVALRTPSRLDRIPPPAAAISSYDAPSIRFSKSTRRGLTNTGWVCESTNPGVTTLQAQSISVSFLRFFLIQGSRSASFVGPTETILPPMQSTAPSDDPEFHQ